MTGYHCGICHPETRLLSDGTSCPMCGLMLSLSEAERAQVIADGIKARRPVKQPPDRQDAAGLA